MNKFLTKIATAFVGMTMAIGVGVALGANREVKESRAAGSSDWLEVTSIETGSSNYYVIANSTKASYVNGSTSSNKFSASAFSNSAPSGTNANGVITFSLVENTTNHYKMNIRTGASETKYMVLSKAGSGGCKLQSSDDYGWTLTYNSTTKLFRIVYQQSFSGSYGMLRYYSSTVFNSYASNSSYGEDVKIYKYNASSPQTISGNTTGEIGETGVVLTSSVSNTNWAIVTDGTTAAGAAVTKLTATTARVTASGAGTVVVESTLSGYARATHTIVFVKQATGLTITASKTTAYAGESINITGSLTGGDGEFEKTIGWTSSNTDVIANPSDSEDGVAFSITPNAVESDQIVTLTGTVSNPGSATNSVDITVKPQRVLKSISVSGDMAKKTYNKGDSWNYAGLKLNGKFDNNEDSELIGDFADLLAAETLTFTANPGTATANTTSISLSNITYGGKTVEGGHTVSNIKVNNVDTDVLTTATFGSPSSYTNWSGKSASSDAVYAGNSNTYSSTAIQLRSENPSGIVTTSSATGLVVTKISVKWNASTTNGRTLTIYGKDTAYSTAADLRDSDKRGNALGTIVKNTSTELTIAPANQTNYIGMMISSGAAYLDSITITWEEPTPVVTQLTLSPSTEQTIRVGNSQTFTVGITGKNLSGNEVATVTYSAVEKTSSGVTLSEESVSANGGQFILTASEADAAGTLKVSCLGVDSNSVDIYTEEAKTLSKIEVTTNGQTGYILGTQFSKAGFVVTATYTDEDTSQVQNSATWNVLRGEDLLSIDTVLQSGDKVRVTYTEGTTKTVDIVLTFIERINDIDGIVAGDQVASKSSSQLGLDNGAAVANVKLNDDITIDGAKGSNANNAPAYYTSGAAVRVYNGNTLTISSEKTISKIVLTMISGQTGNVSVNTGSYSLSNLTGTWTGSATSVTFTHSAASQWHIESFEVTYAGVVEQEISNKYYYAQNAVLQFANYFNEQLDDVCVTADYKSDEFIEQWGLVADKYEDLFIDNTLKLDATNLDIAKQLLKNGVGDYSGDTLQKALARYDRIKTNSDLPQFMVDGTTPLRSNPINRGASQLSNISSSTILLLIVSFLGISAIAGYFLIKRRKEN